MPTLMDSKRPDEETRKRPVLVWIIAFIYGFLAFGGALNTLLLHSGILPVPEPQRSQLAELGALQWVPGLIGSGLMLAFAIALFRLRRSAVRLCEALIALSLLTTGFQLFRVGLPAGPFGAFALASTTFSLTLLAAIYLYTRWLRSRGRLV